MAYNASDNIKTIQEAIGADIDGGWGPETSRKFAEAIRVTQAELYDRYGDQIEGGAQYGADGFYGAETNQLFDLAVADGAIDADFAAAIKEMHENGDLVSRNTSFGHDMTTNDLIKDPETGQYSIEGGENAFKADILKPVPLETVEVSQASIIPDISLPDIEWNEFDRDAHVAIDTKNPIQAEDGSALAAEAVEAAEGTQNGVATFDTSQTVFDGIAKILVNEGNLEGNGGTLTLEQAARTIHYAGTDEANWTESGFGISEVGALADRARILSDRSDVIPDELDVNDPDQLEILVSSVTMVNNWDSYREIAMANGLDPVETVKTPISEGSPNWSDEIAAAVDKALPDADVPEETLGLEADEITTPAVPIITSDAEVKSGEQALPLDATSADADVDTAVSAAVDANNPFALEAGSTYGDITAAQYDATQTDSGLLKFSDMETGAEPFIETLSVHADLSGGLMTMADAITSYEGALNFGTGNGFGRSYAEIAQVAGETNEALGYTANHLFDVYDERQLADLAQGVSAYANGISVEDLPNAVKVGIESASGLSPEDAQDAPDLHLSSADTNGLTTPTTLAFGEAGAVTATPAVLTEGGGMPTQFSAAVTDITTPINQMPNTEVHAKADITDADHPAASKALERSAPQSVMA